MTSEFLGTALLLAAVVGSGIMGERLAGGNVAMALLANTVATASMLPVVIVIFGPVSGAHLNPAVTLVDAWQRTFPSRDVGPYLVAQVTGAVVGVIAAHAMFELPLLQVSGRIRDGAAQGLSEAVATFGLVSAILACRQAAPRALPFIVALFVASAYWFTASTSFANPAVTMARSLTDTFAGIRPSDVLPFVGAQAAGASAAAAFSTWLWGRAPALRSSSGELR